MADDTYLRPEYTPLFSQIQDYIASALNSDPQISATGVKFYPEHILDIEFQIKENLGKQGSVGVVNTLKGEYGGHNGTTQAWNIEAEIDIFENPTIRRAQMKKLGLSSGTTADLIDWVSESICGPTSPTYGKFCAVSQQMGEDSGIVVGKSIMKTYAIADVSGIVSGNNGWHIPYALWSDLSALSGQVMELSDIVISGLGGDYLPLSGGEMSGPISWDYGGMGGPMINGPWSPTQLDFTTTYSELSDKHAFLDFGRIDESGQATIAYLEDLSGISPDVADGKTYIWNYNGNTPVSAFSFKGTLTKADIDELALPTSTYYCVRVGTDVSALGDAAFFDYKLWELHLPWTLREIGVSAIGVSKVSNGQLRYFDIYGRDNQMEYQTTANSSKQHGFLTIKEFAFANQQNLVMAHFPPYQSINLSTASFYNCKVYQPTVMAHGIFFDDLLTGYKEGQIVQTIAAWNSTNWEDIGLLSSDVKAWMPVYYEWLEKQKYGQIPWTHLSGWSYISSVRRSQYAILPYQYTFIDNLANDYDGRTRTWYFTFFNGTSADICREAWLDLSVHSEWTNPGITFQPALSSISALNFDINTFFEAGTRRKYHIFETEPGKLILERMYEGEGGGDYLPLSTTTTQTLQIVGGNNSGWQFLDANNNPMLRIDEYGTYSNKRLDIYGELYYQNQALSDYVDGRLPSVPDKLSQLSNDVGYITDAALSGYLPLSGGMMTGGLSAYDIYYGQFRCSEDTRGCFVANTLDSNDYAIFPVGSILPDPKILATQGYVDGIVGDISALIHAT